MTSTAALFEGVLVLPRPQAEQAAAEHASFTEAQLGALLRDAVETIRRTRADSEVRGTIASLLPVDTGEAITALSRTVVSELGHGHSSADAPDFSLDRPGLAAFLYDRSVDMVATGEIEHAIILLAALSTVPVEHADGLLGLAVCAARLRRYPEALVLATESLQRKVNHPRACCIVGLCELERGDRRAAQNYLAMAARLARQKPAWREELRTAQRLLLMMHIAQ